MNLLSGASKHFSLSLSLFKLFLRTCRAVEIPMSMDYADQGFLAVDLGWKFVTVLGFFAFKHRNTSFCHTLM
jgi:hypothetical protein